MKFKIRTVLLSGLVCGLFVALAAWYTIRFNDSRLITPTDLSQYTFRVQDLPMILSGIVLALYLIFIFVLLFCTILKNRQRHTAVPSTRTVDPRLGFLGLLGFAGFLGFWTYSMDKTIFPFLFFIFFGFFGFFYEGKLSNTLMDERYLENRQKAETVSNKTALLIIVIAAFLIGQGRLLGSWEYSLIALIIIIACAVALGIFLQEYLLYRYDHCGFCEESEE